MAGPGNGRAWHVVLTHQSYWGQRGHSRVNLSRNDLTGLGVEWQQERGTLEVDMIVQEWEV